MKSEKKSTLKYLGLFFLFLLSCVFFLYLPLAMSNFDIIDSLHLSLEDSISLCLSITALIAFVFYFLLGWFFIKRFKIKNEKA